MRKMTVKKCKIWVWVFAIFLLFNVTFLTNAVEAPEVSEETDTSEFTILPQTTEFPINVSTTEMQPPAWLVSGESGDFTENQLTAERRPPT